MGLIAGTIATGILAVIICSLLVVVTLFYWKNKNKYEEEEIPNEIRCLFLPSLPYSSIHPFIYPSIHSVIHSFIHQIKLYLIVIQCHKGLHRSKSHPKLSEKTRPTIRERNNENLERSNSVIHAFHPSIHPLNPVSFIHKALWSSVKLYIHWCLEPVSVGLLQIRHSGRSGLCSVD